MMQTAAGDIRDALDPIPLQQPSALPWLLILAAAAALALTACAVVWLARHLLRRRRTLAETPEQTARRRLALLPVANSKSFYFQLTAILIEYLDAHFALALAACTSAELLSRLRSVEMMPPDCEAALQDLLVRCDRAKFAPALDGAHPAADAELCRAVIEMFAAHIAITRRLAQPAAA